MVLAVLILITTLPALIPVGGDVLIPGEVDRVLIGLGHWLSRHGRTLVTIVLGALGGYLLVRGAIGV